ncbi:MAG: tetratricopeptide repeat protein [Pseudomonadota bacterium]
MNDLTEEQQVERLREWWSQYGMLVIIGVVIFCGAFFGTRYWRNAELKHSQDASEVYAQAGEAASASELEALQAGYVTLKADYADTPYPVQAGLRLAALYMQRGEIEEAETVLKEVLTSNQDDVIEPIIATRLARVQLYADRPDDALGTLSATEAGNQEPLFNELRGDAHVARGDADAARAAYEAARDAGTAGPLVDPLVIEMKLADLARATAATASPPTTPAQAPAASEDAG